MRASLRCRGKTRLEPALPRPAVRKRRYRIHDGALGGARVQLSRKGGVRFVDVDPTAAFIPPNTPARRGLGLYFATSGGLVTKLGATP
jgi:hypothetical protein